MHIISLSEPERRFLKENLKGLLLSDGPITEDPNSLTFKLASITYFVDKLVLESFFHQFPRWKLSGEMRTEDSVIVQVALNEEASTG